MQWLCWDADLAAIFRHKTPGVCGCRCLVPIQDQRGLGFSAVAASDQDLLLKLLLGTGEVVRFCVLPEI
jgi:hypothetical protein